MSDNKISIGVNGWVWTSPFDTSAVHLIKQAHEIGFTTFTVPVEEPDLIDVAAIKSIVADYPMELVVSGAYGPTRDLTHEDPQFRQESLDYIAKTLIICEQLGAKHLVGPAYSAVGKRRQISAEQKQREWDLAVKGLTQAGNMAADHGVVMGIEPLNRFETDLINTSAQVKQLVGNINLPSVKIHLDTFHMNIEEQDVYQAIVSAGDDLVYVDASESHRGTPGEGLVHWDKIAKALNDIQYSGACVIETFTPACEAIADAAAIWRPLAPSQDHIAERGFKFLSALLHGTTKQQ